MDCVCFVIVDKVEDVPVEAKAEVMVQQKYACRCKECEEGNGTQRVSRLYSVPVESLRRRVVGSVDLDCKSGPPTVLNENEEDRLAQYIVEMADMGFGLSPEDV